ncbi:myb-related transcription factor, partner of profilin-like [Ambystoma mexicanum]|uniref:myb-related transcription factor, partner of profilin-like n=1 Tax=Ambystoma mexicanum TaxID=8296 RepID=UPI0037E716D6
MPKAFKESTDRQRKEKFTPEELNMLTQTLAENADVVFANDMRRPTILKKKDIWEQVAVKVSAVGTSTRTVRECRKRWDDLRLRVRGILAENHRIASEGGAGSPSRLKEWEETCGNLIAVESIEGVGSMEFGVGTTSDAEHAPFQTPGSDVTVEENNPAIMSPMVASPAAVDASEGTATSAQSPSTALQLTTILERQRELTVLVGQHVEEVAHLRENIAGTARHSTDRMDANTDRLCTEISRLREVLSRMADAMDRHFLKQGQSAPSSSSGSRQTSPLRRSTRTTRRSSAHSQNAATDNDK